MSNEFPNVEGVEFRFIDDARRYCVGSDGTVWSRANGRWDGFRQWRKLSPGRNRWGYQLVVVPFNGRFRTMPVHRLVAHFFIGPRPAGLETRHGDGNKDNNAKDNLSYGTKSENTFDAIRHGRHPCLKVGGEGNPKAKLTLAEVREIRRMASQGFSPASIHRLNRFTVSKSTIERVVNGKLWPKVDGRRDEAVECQGK